MREDMSRVIVERPRLGGHGERKGRVLAYDDLPKQEGMRRQHKLSGDYKMLNENLSPMRRYLERQVGRPWGKVYSEIARHLRADNTVQQHVRDHLADFVAVKPRRLNSARFSRQYGLKNPECLWFQPFYVDPQDGLLKRTDRLPEVKARHRARKALPAPPDRIVLTPERELRRIDGLWFEVTLVPLPEPDYREFKEVQKVPLKPYVRNSPYVEVEVTIRRLVSPAVLDVAYGAHVLLGPAIDTERAWADYRRSHPDRRYVIAKRALARGELRHHGLTNRPT